MQKNHLMKTCLLLFTLTLFSSISFSQDSLYSKVFYDDQALEGQTSCLSFHDGLLLVNKAADGTNVLLIDSLGEQIWSIYLNYTTNITDFHFNQAIQTVDSCFLLAGNAYNHVDAQYEGYLIKLNQTGDTLWSRTFTTNSLSSIGYDESDVFSIVQQPDSSFVFVGTAGPHDDDLDQRMLMGKIDFDGQLVWSNVYELFNKSVKPRKIIVAPNGNYYVSGQMFEELNAIYFRGFISEFASSGNLLWAKKIHSLKIHDMILKDSALFFMAESDQPEQSFLIKTDLLGNPIWNNLYNWSSEFSGEKQLRLTNLSDHQFLMYDNNRYGMGSSMYKVDTAGTFLESKSLFLGAENIFERDHKGIYVVGIGPLYGIRADIYQPQVGVIKTDSLFQHSFCINLLDPLEGMLVPSIIDTLSTPFTIVDTLLPRSIEIDLNLFDPSNFEGCVSYLGGLNETSMLALSVYPNVSTGIFNLEQETLETLEISVFDSQGKVIIQQKMNEYSSVINLSQQTDGIYFYKVTSTDNRMKTGKLVVAK